MMGKSVGLEAGLGQPPVFPPDEPLLDHEQLDCLDDREGLGLVDRFVDGAHLAGPGIQPGVFLAAERVLPILLGDKVSTFPRPTNFFSNSSTNSGRADKAICR